MINIKKIIIVFLFVTIGRLDTMYRGNDDIPEWLNKASIISFYQESREVLKKAQEEAFDMKEQKKRAIEKEKDQKDQKDHEKMKSKL